MQEKLVFIMPLWEDLLITAVILFLLFYGVGTATGGHKKLKKKTNTHPKG